MARSLPLELLWLLESAQRVGLRPTVSVELGRGPSLTAEQADQMAIAVLDDIAKRMFTDLDRHGIVPRLRFFRDGVMYVAWPIGPQQ